MRLDAHQHFWKHDPVRDAWITDDMAVLRRDFLPGDLQGELAAVDMDGCIAVQADTSEDETRFLLELAGRHASVRGVVGWVDLCAGDVGERLEHFSRFEDLRGVRQIVQAEADDYLERPDVRRGIGMLGDFGLTYDILVYERQLPAALSLVDALPEQAFVVDHMAKPRIADGVLEPWASHMRELAGHPNVWCKVSGLVTEADWAGWRPEDVRPYLDVVFEAFGPGRLMFGSDWPVCLLAGSYREVHHLVDAYTAELPQDDRAALFGGNAARFYGLTPHRNEAR
jgi:L-fuconolactonase